MWAALWRGSRLALLLGALGGALGVAVWFAFDCVGAAAVQGLERAVSRGALPSVITTSTAGFDGENVRVVLPRQLGVVGVEHDGRRLDVALVGAQLAMEEMARPGRLGGLAVADERVGADSIALDRATAQQLGVELGGRLTLHAADRATAVVLAAVFDELGPGIRANRLAFTELATSRRVLGRDRIDACEVLFAPDVDPEREIAAARQRVGAGVDAQVTIGRRSAAASIAAMRTTWRLAAWLALAIGAIALAAVVRDQVRARRQDLELLHAIGAGPAVRAVVAIAPAALVVAIAAVVGALLGDLAGAAFAPGIAAWVEMQTGVGIVIELPARSAVTWLLLLGAAVAFAVGVAWRGRFGGAGLDASVPDDGAVAFTTARVWRAAAALLAVIVITCSGLLRVHTGFRVLDLLLGVAVAFWSAPPVAALLMRSCCRLRANGPIVLAAARMRQQPGGLLGAVRLGAVGGAVIMALAGVAASLRRAAPGVVDAAVAGRAVTSIADLLGMAPLVGVGSIDVDSGRHAARLRAVAERAIGSVDDMNVALALLTGLGVALLLWLDVRRRRGADAVVVAIGAVPSQRIATAAMAAAAVGGGIAVAAALAGGVIGFAWTRGTLHQVLGWDCDFVVAPAVALALLAVPAVTGVVAAVAARLQPTTPC